MEKSPKVYRLDKLNKKEVRTKRLQSFPLSRLFPNMVTLLALCAGLSSIRFALLEKWELSVACIVIAAFMDAIDGRLARLLNSTSSFGAELDSLTDFVNFGIAPALVMYLWKVQELPVKGLGWAVVLFFSVCCAIRLARFNSALEEEKPDWANKFFVGIPSTVGGGLCIVPMMLSFHLADYPVIQTINQPIYLAAYMTVIALFMCSRIPTFSAKTMSVRREYASILLMVAGILIIGLILEPWVTLPVAGAVYILTIPVSLIRFYQLKNVE